VDEIKFTRYSFAPNMKLKYLCLDENFIKSFNNLAYAAKLQHLFIRYNKCSEYSELDGLKELLNLKELELTNNPISRKHGNRFNIL
jgi:Leucine-rich repeat (LRR) protein